MMPKNMEEVFSQLRDSLNDIINHWNNASPDALAVWIRMLVGDLEALEGLAKRMSDTISDVNRERK